jgi:G3E family GTPase
MHFSHNVVFYVSVVDAEHFLTQLDKRSNSKSVNSIIEPVVFADRIILNKIDQVNPDILDQTWQRLAAINPRAQIAIASYCVC